MIEVPGRRRPPARQLSRQALADVIEPRVSELFELVQAELRRSGYEELLSSGIVLTGGSAVMQRHGRAGRGDLPHAGARLGVPQYAAAWPTWCATALRHRVGLLMEGAAQQRSGRARHGGRAGSVPGSGQFLNGFRERVSGVPLITFWI
jgi:cell division protein FtsA